MHPPDRTSDSADVLAVLIPARDEEASLPGVLEALRSAGTADRVVVVDNGSRDRTTAAARAGGAEVVEEPRPGYGRACQRGIAHLASAGARPSALAFLDADDRRGPRQIPRVAGPILEGRADLVLGARRRADGVPLHAALGNWLVTRVLAGLYGWPGRDQGPLRAVRFSSLLRLGLDDPDYGWNVQMHVRALRAGLRVREVAVRFEPRRRGRSKISGRVAASVRAGVRMLATLAGEAIRRGGKGFGEARGGGGGAARS